MRTTIILQDGLVERLVSVGGFRTRTAAIQTAIEEYIARRERQELAQMAGKVKFFDDHLHVLDKLEEEE